MASQLVCLIDNISQYQHINLMKRIKEYQQLNKAIEWAEQTKTMQECQECQDNLIKSLNIRTQDLIQETAQAITKIKYRYPIQWN